MRTKILFSVGIAWLLFCGFWAFLACGFATEQPPAGHLRDCLIILLIFVIVALGPIVAVGLVVRRREKRGSQSRKNEKREGG